MQMREEEKIAAGFYNKTPKITRPRNRFTQQEQELMIQLKMQDCSNKYIVNELYKLSGIKRDYNTICTKISQLKKKGLTSFVSRDERVVTSYAVPTNVMQAIKQSEIGISILSNVKEFLLNLNENELKSINILSKFEKMKNIFTEVQANKEIN